MSFHFFRAQFLLLVFLGLMLLCPITAGAVESSITITSFDVRPTTLSLGEPFEIHLAATAKGDVKIGSYVVRISHPIAKSDAPPPFSLYRNNRAYLPEDGSYSLMDNGKVDTDPKKGAFGVEIPTEGWRDGIYYITAFAHNRPAPGDHIVDHRNISVTVKNGQVTIKDLGKRKTSGEDFIRHFSVDPTVLSPGEPFDVVLETAMATLWTWSLRHPYTILEEETLPGFYFNAEKKQAYYRSEAGIQDNGEYDKDPSKGELRLTIDTTAWPTGIHNFTIEAMRREDGPYIPSSSAYRDFGLKIADPKDHLEVKIKDDRYFAEGTHFNTLFVLSNGRVICDGRYSDDKGYTWHEYDNKSVQWGTSHARSAIMAHEFPNGEVIGLAYRTLPREGEKGVFLGQLYVSKDRGKTIEGPFEAVFHVPRAVGSKGHAFHPGPLFMRSIVQIEDGSLLALMCGWFDTDTRESPHKGQNYRRSFVCRSTDRGRTWEYYSTIAYKPNWGSEGWNEGSLRRLPDGRLIAAVRSGSESSHWKDNPLCMFFSEDEGKTWSGPHRSGIDGVYPSLVVMSNGLLACSYGRPGAKIMFSADNGETWTDHTLVNPERYSGYTWIGEVAPGELLYGYGLRNGLDPETGERRNMLRLVNIRVSE